MGAPAQEAVPVATAILKGIGAPVDQQNIGAMIGWFNAEGGHWGNSASFNPLNTTQGAPGARPINGVGVKAYGNWQQGIGATIQTLRNGRYGSIIQAFRSSNPQMVARAIGSSPWGTNGSLAAQTISAATGQHFNLAAGATPGVGFSQIPGTGLNLSIPNSAQTFNAAGFQQARDRYIAGQALKQADSASIGIPGAGAKFSSSLGSGDSALFGKGLLTTTAPSPQDYIKAQSSLQQLAIPALLKAHPVVQGASGRVSDIAGGFLAPGAKYVQGRKDQGRDGQTAPGAPIVADGNGVVVNVLSDPNGFGPRYPVVHFLSGHYAGRTLYFGHTLAAVRPGQRVRAGQVLSYTGTSPVGNASVPGWFEIGFADSGAPGPLGQPAPF